MSKFGVNLLFSLTDRQNKFKDPNPTYSLVIDGGRIFRIIPYPRLLVPWEMQVVCSRYEHC